MFTFIELPITENFSCDRCIAIYGEEWAKIASFIGISPFLPEKKILFCTMHKNQIENQIKIEKENKESLINSNNSTIDSLED